MTVKRDRWNTTKELLFQLAEVAMELPVIIDIQCFQDRSKLMSQGIMYYNNRQYDEFTNKLKSYFGPDIGNIIARYAIPIEISDIV